MITQDKITEIYCVTDEFSKLFDIEFSRRGLGKSKRNRKATLSDAEIMTILIMYYFGSFRNFKHFYLMHICKTMRNNFPDVVSYNRFIELQNRVFFKIFYFFQNRSKGGDVQEYRMLIVQ